MTGLASDPLAGLIEAGEKARTAVVQRDQAIVAAVHSGRVSQREVARAVGLSHTAVQRIVAKGSRLT